MRLGTLGIYLLLAIITHFNDNQISAAAPGRGSGIGLKVMDIVRELRDGNEIEKQIACIVNQGPCDDRGIKLKTYLPDISTGNGRCYRCTRDEERKLKLIISTLQTRFPRCWNVVVLTLQKKVSPPPRAKGCA